MCSILNIKTLILPLAIVLLAFAGISQNASAHEWTLKVNGKEQKIEAKVVDFDGKNVLLEADNGVRKSFPINELTDDDLEYVKNIVVARQTAVQEKLNLKQLQQERLNNQLQFRDIWEVQLYALDGTYILRRFLARNNYQAEVQAKRQYPNARIGGVRKVFRREGLQL